MKELLITSSVLIGVLTAVRFLFRRRISRRLQYALWALVLARLLLPVPLPQASFSVMNGAEALTARLETVQTVPAVPVSSAAPAPGAYRPAPVQMPPVQAAPEAPARALSAGEVLRILWLAGIAVTAACFLASNLRLARRLRRNRTRIDTDCPLPVYVSGAVVSPCLFGLIRPAVYVTPKAAASPERLRHVLTHELCHYRHGDHVWSVLRCVCLTVYWFDPLVWLAAALSKADSELACDEAAIRALGEAHRLAYGRTLVDMIAVERPATGMLCAATAMVSGRRSLRGRVNRIARHPKAFLSAALAAVLMAAVVAGCTFTAATEPPAPMDILEYAGDGGSFPGADGWEFQYDVDPQRFQGLRMWTEIWRDGQMEVLSGGTMDLTEPRDSLTISLQEEENDAGGRSVTPCMGAGGASLSAQTCSLPEGDFPARTASWLGGASDEQPFSLQPDTPVVLACVAYQSAEDDTIASYDCSFLTEDPGRLAEYRFSVVFKAVFTSGSPEDYALPVSTAPKETPAAPDGVKAEATYAVSLIQDGAETWLDLDDDALLQDVIFNSLVRSAAWPNKQPADAYPYAIRIRQTVDGTTRDYYACRQDGAAILMGPDMYTGLSEELMARLEAAAGLLPGGAYSLDEAISQMILRIYADPWVEDGQQAVESHVVLGTEKNGGEITAYVEGMYMVYSNQDGRLVQDGVGGHMPMAFTFERDETGAYQCREVWRCQGGAYYAPSIREKFPPDLAEEAIDTQRFGLALTQACQQRGAAALGIDTDAELERLLHNICRDGGGAEACIDAHHIDYREMTWYGDCALNYAINRLLDGGGDELEQEVLWQLLHDIYPREIEALESPAADAQTEFNEWRDYVTRIADLNGEEYYQHNRTACALLACHHARSTPAVTYDAYDEPAADAAPDLYDTPAYTGHHAETHHGRHH